MTCTHAETILDAHGCRTYCELCGASWRSLSIERLEFILDQLVAGAVKSWDDAPRLFDREHAAARRLRDDEVVLI